MPNFARCRHRLLSVLAGLLVLGAVACSSDNSTSQWRLGDHIPGTDAGGASDTPGTASGGGGEIARDAAFSDSPSPFTDAANSTDAGVCGIFGPCGRGHQNDVSGMLENQECWGTQGQWVCNCAISPDRSALRDHSTDRRCLDHVDSTAQQCRQALAEVCNNDVCRLNWNGMHTRCDPTDDGRWRCRCDEGQDAVVVDAESCTAALATCMPECSSDAGTCRGTGELGQYECRCDGVNAWRPTTGYECDWALHKACETDEGCSANGDRCIPDKTTGKYVCTCTSYYDTTRNVQSNDCDGAIEHACSPRRQTCDGWSGYCDETAAGYECHCQDGSTTTLDRDAVFAAPEHDGSVCTTAVEMACGPSVQPGTDKCEASTPQTFTQCERPEDADPDTPYRCSCSYRCADGSSIGNDGSSSASTCQDALADFACPSGC